MKKPAFLLGFLIVGAIVAMFVLGLTPQGQAVTNSLVGSGQSVAGVIWMFVLALAFILMNFVFGSLFRSKIVPIADKLAEPDKPFSFGQHLLIALIFGLAAGGLQLVGLTFVNSNSGLATFLNNLGNHSWWVFGPITTLSWFLWGMFAFVVSYFLTGSHRPKPKA
jgi:hypothetical protein